MAVLSAVFKGVDEISSVFERMAASGAQAVEQWDSASAAASSAFEQATSGAESAAESMSQAASSTDQLTTAVDSYDQAASKAADAADDLTDAVTDVGNRAKDAGKKGQDAIKALSSAMAAAGITKMVHDVADSLLEAAHAAARAETAFAKLQTIAGNDAMGTLTTEIKSLSAETGIAQEALADVAYNAISAGTAVKDAVNVAGSASKLATAGFTDTSSALSVLSTAMNSYGDAAGTAEEISNSLIMVQNLGVTTVADLAASMGKSISTASAYNVSLGNLESAYVSITKAGINTAEATTYVSAMMSELGKEGSTVSNILQEQTGQSFGQLMTSGYSLADILEILYDAAGKDAEAMMNLWGSQTAGVAASAIVNQGLSDFNSNLLLIENSAGATEAAYATMATTTEFAQQRMQTSMENLKIAIGGTLAPALENMYSVGANAFQCFADFATEHPALVTALSVLAGVLVAVTTAIGALLAVFAIKMAILPILTGKVTVFGVALNAAIWPITLIVAGIAALVAIGAVLFNWLNSVDEEWAALSATSKQHYEEVERLNEEYERTVELEGENSEAAQKLAADLEAAKAVYEANKMTIEEFVAQNDKLIESQQKVAETYNENIVAINAEEKSSSALIAKLAELQNKTNLTASEQQQMSAVVDKLNSQVPGLALAYDKTTGSLNRSVAEMRKMAEAQAEVQRQQKQAEAYAEAVAQQIELEEQLAKAKEQVAAAEENKHGWGWFGASKQSYKDLEAFTAEQERLQAALDENNRIISETEQAWQEAEKAAEEAAKAPVAYEDAVNSAIQSVSEDLNELIQKYDEAYEAARNSLDGTFELFEKVEEKSGVSSQAIIDAWQSQIEFFNEYNKNLQKLQDMDLDPKFLAQLSDGSQESAGQVKALMQEIESLDSKDAAAKIQEINKKFGELSKAKDNTATTMAEIQTDFDNELNKIENRMGEAIDNMTMDDEARTAAKETISAYISQISSMTGEARSAAEGVAKAATNALSGKGISTVGIPGFASGTDNAPRGVALVGEEGPELVRFNGGEQIYTADETNQILARTATMNTPTFDADSHVSVNADPGDGPEYGGNEVSYRSTEEKKITLDINGTGELDVTGADEETVWGIVSPKLREAFMGIVRAEIFEEGDRAYAF